MYTYILLLADELFHACHDELYTLDKASELDSVCVRYIH